MGPMHADDLRDLTQRYLATGAAPGAAVAIVRDGAVVDAFALGLADPSRGTPLDLGHLFEIGSISKSFTALCVLSLVDQGAVSLADPVTAHLLWFEVRTEHPPIGVRHLLDHSSGLVMGSDSHPDEAAQVYSLRTTETGSAPGTIFHYSNVGYMALGQLVQAVTGRPCTEVMRDVVVDVVGMPDTITTITDDDRPRMAVGQQPWHEDRPWRPGDPLAPATWMEVSAADGNVASTAPDMGRYLAMLLGGGEIDGRRVVSPESWTEMVTPSSPGGEPAPGWSFYGLGINVEKVHDRTVISHGGGMVGYSTFMLGELDRGFGVVVLTHAPGDSHGAEWVARALYDVVHADVEGHDRAPLPTYVAEPKPALPQGDDGSVEARLAAYVGHYRAFTPWFTHLRVAAYDGRLWLVAPNGVEAPGLVELVELEPGLFREGADPRLPERLRIGPVLEGHALWVERHDCRYSRTFRD